MPNVSETIGQAPCFRSNCVFREVTPVTHISLKTDWADYREQCWKKISGRDFTQLNVIGSSTKRFLEILSNVLVAQERSLSFINGKQYFGKHRASWINLFWKC